MNIQFHFRLTYSWVLLLGFAELKMSGPYYGYMPPNSGVPGQAYMQPPPAPGQGYAPNQYYAPPPQGKILQFIFSKLGSIHNLFLIINYQII